MSLNDTLKKWSNNTITVQSFQGFDEFANATWAVSSDSVSYSALISHTARIVRDQQGALVTSPTQIYLSGNSTIQLEDKITLSDGSTPQIVSIQYNTDFVGNVCYTVIFT